MEAADDGLLGRLSNSSSELPEHPEIMTQGERSKISIVSRITAGEGLCGSRLQQESRVV